MATLNPRLTPPNRNSDGNVWLSWYEQLESNFGKKDAALAFTKRWANVKPEAGNDNNLRTKMTEYGINIQPNGIFGSIEDTAKSFTGGLASFMKMGATAAIIVQIVVVIFALLIIWRLAKPEAVGTVIKYAK
jgi:hypothetical protein